MIVLSWLRSPARKWTTFVANRVGEIQELTDIGSWGHVSTLSNPADLLSRGATAERLSRENLWWEEPAWLSTGQEGWPSLARVTLQDLPEQRKICVVATYPRSDVSLFERYSSLNKFVTVVAYCRRFLRNARSSSGQRKFGRLPVKELYGAQSALERVVQENAFSEELRALRAKRDFPPSNSLITLKPFLDEQDLIRVGERLRNSQLPYARKHPVVLPRKHPFTELVIRHRYEGQLHAGQQATLTAVRRRYWPLAARGTVRWVVRNCFKCCKASPSTSQQIMGDLPEERVVPSRPFARTGVDYAGPFLAKESKRRNSKLRKVYIAIFVCLATKALHLDVVGDLTAEAFVGSLKRFIARRGKPVEMFSDNGSTFVGAHRELKELHEAFKNQEAFNKILRFIDEQSIGWRFIPPRGPHFGGLWEAGVKAMKHHLKRVAGEASLTHEELITLISQIEAVLNSRPISALSGDPGDLEALTPGHFLIGDALTSPLEPDLKDVRENRLSRWQRVEQLRHHFNSDPNGLAARVVNSRKGSWWLSKRTTYLRRDGRCCAVSRCYIPEPMEWLGLLP